jgi:hypothetical protein
MANIDRIVNVQIALQTAAVTVEGFGDLMLLGKFTPKTTEKVIIITGADDLLDYAVLVTDSLYLAAQVAFSQIPTIPRIFVGNDDGVTVPATLMSGIAAENNNWYAFCNTGHQPTRVLGFAAWAEANTKLFVTALQDPTTISAPGTDTTSIAHQLMTNNYFRTAWWYNPDAKQFPEVAITCRSFTKYPGQETWANQRLDAVVSTNLSETSAQNVFAKNGNTFEPFRNIAITQNGQVAGGEWIDIIRFRDWLVEEIRTRVFNQMVDNRIPYTDPGIAIIHSRLRQALDFGVARGGIAPVELSSDGKLIPSYIIEVPLASNVSVSDKANRILRDVYFTARLAGAIHVVEIKGTLVYENLAVAA